MKGEIDRRQFNHGVHTEASLSIDQFFLELYHSAAEALPETISHVDSDEPVPQQESAESDLLVVLTTDPGKSRLNDIPSVVAADNFPIRHIQHSKTIDLWFLYLSWMSSHHPLLKHGSWTTFWSKWKHRSWAQVLVRRSS